MIDILNIIIYLLYMSDELKNKLLDVQNSILNEKQLKYEKDYNHNLNMIEWSAVSQTLNILGNFIMDDNTNISSKVNYPCLKAWAS